MTRTAVDRRIFVDTSAYYAAVDPRDAGHIKTTLVMRRLVENRHQFVTTNAVLFEVHSLLLNRINRQVAWKALVELHASQTMVRVRERDEARAVEILGQYDDKDFSFTAAISFAVMERLGIRAAFTLDHHFGPPLRSVWMGNCSGRGIRSSFGLMSNFPRLKIPGRDGNHTFRH